MVHNPDKSKIQVQTKENHGWFSSFSSFMILKNNDSCVIH